MPQQSFTYEAFPRSVQDASFILTSIKTELNGFHSIKAEYAFKYVLFRNKTGIYLKRYISSNSEAWISVLLNFYEKLYSGNVAFQKVNDPKIQAKPLHFYSIRLNNHNSFSCVRPWEIWLNTFSSSAGLIENTLNETALNLNVGEFVRFDFRMIPSSYDRIAKEILYTIKEMGKSEEYKRKLRWSFSDKLGFFLFDLKASHNLKNESFFWDILHKNLGLYDSDWNRYSYEYSNKKFPSVPRRKSKWQIDLFLSNWFLTLISENNRYVSKLPSKILPITPRFALSGGTGKEKGEIKAYMGKGFLDLRKDNREYVSFQSKVLKNGHVGVVGWTWSGKTYTTSFIAWFDIAKSIVSDRSNFEKNWSPRSLYLFSDPHYGFETNAFGVLEYFNTGTNYGYHSEFRIIEFQKDDNEEISLEQSNLPLKRVKLTLNPLYSGSLGTETQIFGETVEKMATACLAWIIAMHSISSFWPQNSDILTTAITLFIISNAIRKEGNVRHSNEPEKYQRMFDLSDIHSFLEEMEIRKGIPDFFRKDLVNGLNHQNQNVAEHVKKLKTKLDYYSEQLKKTPWYLSSSINKLAVYASELKRTFWNGTYYESYSLDLSELYLKKDYQKTRICLFNLSDFTIGSKNIITGFLLTYMYHYGTMREHEDKTNVVPTYLWIDEASSVLGGEYVLNVLASCLAEIRKHGFSLILLYRTIGRHGFSSIYPNLWSLWIFSVDHSQAEILLDDLNSGCPWTLLCPNDIVNNQRGRYYGFFKLTNGGNSTLLIEGLSGNGKELEYLIS